MKVSLGKKDGVQPGRSKPQHLPNTLPVLVMEFPSPTLTAPILQPYSVLMSSLLCALRYWEAVKNSDFYLPL